MFTFVTKVYNSIRPIILNQPCTVVVLYPLLLVSLLLLYSLSPEGRYVDASGDERADEQGRERSADNGSIRARLLGVVWEGVGHLGGLHRCVDTCHIVNTYIYISCQGVKVSV